MQDTVRADTYIEGAAILAIVKRLQEAADRAGVSPAMVRNMRGCSRILAHLAGEAEKQADRIARASDTATAPTKQ